MAVSTPSLPGKEKHRRMEKRRRRNGKKEKRNGKTV